MVNRAVGFASLLAVIGVSIVFGMLLGGRLNAPQVVLAAPQSTLQLAPAASGVAGIVERIDDPLRYFAGRGEERDLVGRDGGAARQRIGVVDQHGVCRVETPRDLFLNALGFGHSGEHCPENRQQGHHPPASSDCPKGGRVVHTFTSSVSSRD